VFVQKRPAPVSLVDIFPARGGGKSFAGHDLARFILLFLQHFIRGFDISFSNFQIFR
jgi:hypothetical protein